MQLAPLWLAVNGHKFHLANGVISTAFAGADHGQGLPNRSLNTFKQVNAIVKRPLGWMMGSE